MQPYTLPTMRIQILIHSINKYVLSTVDEGFIRRFYCSKVNFAKLKVNGKTTDRTWSLTCKNGDGLAAAAAAVAVAVFLQFPLVWLGR